MSSMIFVAADEEVHVGLVVARFAVLYTERDCLFGLGAASATHQVLRILLCAYRGHSWGAVQVDVSCRLLTHATDLGTREVEIESLVSVAAQGNTMCHSCQ